MATSEAMDGDVLADTPASHVVPWSEAKAMVVESFERLYLTRLLELSGGNMSKAARIGQMDRMYLHRLCQKYGLRPPRGDRQ